MLRVDAGEYEGDGYKVAVTLAQTISCEPALKLFDRKTHC